MEKDKEKMIEETKNKLNEMEKNKEHLIEKTKNDLNIKNGKKY